MNKTLPFIIFIGMVSASFQSECISFSDLEKLGTITVCDSKSPFPINITVTLELSRDLDWKGTGSWVFYLSDYTRIQQYCLAGMPFPGLLRKGEKLTLQLECDSLPRQLKKYDQIAFIIFYKVPGHKYEEMSYIFIPIPGYSEDTQPVKLYNE